MEIALAGGFWLLSGLVPGGREGILIAAGILGSTGIVLVVVAVVLLGRAAATDRISAMGVVGTGQIMGLRQTGVLIHRWRWTSWSPSWAAVRIARR